MPTTSRKKPSAFACRSAGFTGFSRTLVRVFPSIHVHASCCIGLRQPEGAGISSFHTHQRTVHEQPERYLLVPSLMKTRCSRSKRILEKTALDRGLYEPCHTRLRLLTCRRDDWTPHNLRYRPTSRSLVPASALLSQRRSSRFIIPLIGSSIMPWPRLTSRSGSLRRTFFATGIPARRPLATHGIRPRPMRGLSSTGISPGMTRFPCSTHPCASPFGLAPKFIPDEFVTLVPFGFAPRRSVQVPGSAILATPSNASPRIRFLLFAVPLRLASGFLQTSSHPCPRPILPLPGE